MKCGKPATIESIWANERIMQCPEHATGLQKLGAALGFNTSPHQILFPDLSIIPSCESKVREKSVDNKDK